MEIFEGHRALFRPLACPAITIGNFDGVHLGHRALLDRTRRAADRLDGDAVAMTFEPHPATFLRPDKVPPRLSSLARKQELLAEAGMSVTLLEAFDADFAAITAQQFEDEVLGKILGVKHLVVGDDFGYGKGKAGTIETLRAASQRLGFELDVVGEVRIDGERASSSQIRKHLQAGELDAANRLLGRAYDVDGVVIRGAGRGREFGFPTANLDVGNCLLPAPGIYATEVRILGDQSQTVYMGATSLGTNPTVVDGGALTLEPYLLDFDGDLYDRELRVSFVQFLRPEQRFDDIDALLAQIQKDVDDTRRILKGHP